MIASHWPEAVALSLRNELAHFLIHSFLFLSAHSDVDPGGFPVELPGPPDCGRRCAWSISS